MNEQALSRLTKRSNEAAVLTRCITGIAAAAVLSAGLVVLSNHDAAPTYPSLASQTLPQHGFASTAISEIDAAFRPALPPATAPDSGAAPARMAVLRGTNEPPARY